MKNNVIAEKHLFIFFFFSLIVNIFDLLKRESIKKHTFSRPHTWDYSYYFSKLSILQAKLMIINVCILVGFLHTHGFKYIQKLQRMFIFWQTENLFKTTTNLKYEDIYFLQIVSSKNVKTHEAISSSLETSLEN